MSRKENVQRVKGLFAAIGRGDREGLLALVAEDIEWIIPGENWLLAGTHRGRAEMADFLETASKSMETYAEPREYVAKGNRVLVIGFASGRVKATNKTLEDHWVRGRYCSERQSDEHPRVYRHPGIGAGLADGRVRVSVAVVICGHRAGSGPTIEMVARSASGDTQLELAISDYRRSAPDARSRF